MKLLTDRNEKSLSWIIQLTLGLPDRDDDLVLDAEDDGADDDRGQGRARDERAVGHQERQWQQDDSAGDGATLKRNL